jgi:hypothetical protein
MTRYIISGFVVGIISLWFGYTWGKVPEPQVVSTVPIVNGCMTTNSVTVCTLTDPGTQRHWLIVGSAQGSIAVVEDELR